MKHINITNWQGNITDWTKFNYVYGGLDETIADRVNLSIPGTNLRNYIKKSDNLLPLPNMPQADFYGIKYKVENGVISVWGTATSSVNLWLNMGTELPANTRYYINFFHEGDHEGKIVYNVAKSRNDWTNRVYTLDSAFTFQRDYSISAICLQFDVNKQYNCTFKPMVVYGSVMPRTYEPYGSMVLVENVGTVDLSTLGWAKDTTTRPADGATIHAWYAQLDDCKLNVDGYANMFLDGYTVDTVANVDYGGFSVIKDKLIGGADSNHRIWLYNSAYQNMTLQELQAELSGKILQFELATPKVTIFKQVDLGTLSWTYQAMGDPSYYDAYLPGVVNSINVSCPLYKSAWVFSTNTEDKRICTVQNSVRIRDRELQGSVIDLQAKLKDVIMLYEPASSNANMLGMVKPSDSALTAVEDSMSLDELLEPANEER